MKNKTFISLGFIGFNFDNSSEIAVKTKFSINEVSYFLKEGFNSENIESFSGCALNFSQLYNFIESNKSESFNSNSRNRNFEDSVKIFQKHISDMSLKFKNFDEEKYTDPKSFGLRKMKTKKYK